jgi:hypothetical protein
MFRIETVFNLNLLFLMRNTGKFIYALLFLQIKNLHEIVKKHNFICYFSIA